MHLRVNFMRNICFLIGLLFALAQHAYSQEEKDSSGTKKTYYFNSTPVDLPGPLGIQDSVGRETNITPSVDIDSLKNAIFNMQREITGLRSDISGIQRNLYMAHKKHKMGALLLAGGVAAYILGSISMGPNPTTISQEEVLLILGGIGGVISGTVIMITSHKYIGKAGISYKYNRYNRSRGNYSR
jgi:hypothetical protein